MAYNVEQALKDGVPEEEIARYLAKTRNYRFDEAVKAGIPHREIIDYLAPQKSIEAKPRITEPDLTKKEPSLSPLVEEKPPVALTPPGLAKPVAPPEIKERVVRPPIDLSEFPEELIPSHKPVKPTLGVPSTGPLLPQPRAVDPNKVLAEVLAENPGLAKVHNLDNTSVVSASPERTAAQAKSMAEQGYPKGPGGLEYWPADETGTPGHPHPTGGGKNVLEIYSDELKKNPALLKQAIYGDLFHGMINDPTFNKLREEFKNNYTPEEQKRISDKKSWWEDANGKNANDVAVNDAYIRGWMNERNVAEQGQKESGGTMYSPKQLEILKKMENYIKTAQEGEQTAPIKAQTTKPSILAPAMETVKNLATVYGPVEAAANLVSQMYGLPVVGLAQVAGLPLGKSQEFGEAAAKATVYEPRTEAGKQLTEAVSYPFKLLDIAGEKAAEITREKTGSPVAATAVGTAIKAAPLALGLRGPLKSLTRSAANSAWFRSLTIKERGLVTQSLDDMLNRGYPEAEVLRRWNNPSWREEALRRRNKGEEFPPFAEAGKTAEPTGPRITPPGMAPEGPEPIGSTIPAPGTPPPRPTPAPPPVETVEPIGTILPMGGPPLTPPPEPVVSVEAPQPIPSVGVAPITPPPQQKPIETPAPMTPIPPMMGMGQEMPALAPERRPSPAEAELLAGVKALDENTNRLIQEGGYEVAKQQPKSPKGEQNLLKRGYKPMLWDEATGELSLNPLGVWVKEPAKPVEEAVSAPPGPQIAPEEAKLQAPLPSPAQIISPEATVQPIAEIPPVLGKPAISPLAEPLVEPRGAETPRRVLPYEQFEPTLPPGIRAIPQEPVQEISQAIPPGMEGATQPSPPIPPARGAVAIPKEIPAPEAFKEPLIKIKMSEFEETPEKFIPDDMIVDVRAIREKTGKEITIKQNAREAFSESSERLKRFKDFLDCVKS